MKINLDLLPYKKTTNFNYEKKLSVITIIFIFDNWIFSKSIGENKNLFE